MTPLASALVLFASSFVVVFALGFQQQNVTGGHYIAAFFTSFAIGGSYLFIYKLAPAAGPLEIAGYLGGGPFGIVLSMWAHRRTLGRRRSECTEAERREANRSGFGYQPRRAPHEGQRPPKAPPRRP